MGIMSRISRLLSGRELEESEHRFKCFYEGAAFEGIAITSEGKFIDVNPQFVKMFGYTRKEIIGKPVKDLIHEEDYEMVASNIENEYSGRYNHRAINKDGSVRYVEVCGQHTSYHGEPVRVTAIHDLTDRMLAAEEAKKLSNHKSHSSKMEAIGSFASGIAHDFNNALTPVIGNCDVLLYGMAEDDENREYIVSILTAAETASLLVQRMQSFTRDGDSSDKSKPLELKGCLEETFDFLRQMIPTSVEMKMNVIEPIGLVSATDVTIRQVLMNLCQNAAQAMPDGKGTISIDVRSEILLMSRYGVRKGEYVKITVKDDGLGMSPEVLERAVNPYFTTKQKGKGTGVGLSVVSGIVEGYDGFLRLYSKEGEGSRIVVYIPVVLDGDGIESCSVDEPILLGEGEHVLLVDDQESVAVAVKNILTSLNYKVKAFHNSKDALKHFLVNIDKYDVVVTDLTMPGMSGVTLIREIRKIKPSIRVLLCSGLGKNGRYASDLFSDSKGAYVTKPVTRREYGDALSKILKRKEKVK